MRGYKHGLKLPLSPFGIPTKEAIEERKSAVKSPLFSYTNEPISAMMMLQLGPNQQANLTQLVEERNVLRLRLAHDVDLDAKWSTAPTRCCGSSSSHRLTASRSARSRMATVPGEAKWEQVDVLVKLDRVLTLADFTEPRPARDGGGGRR